MFRIKTLNEISGIIHTHFPADAYEVGAAIDNPHGVLVRSADMQKAEFGSDLAVIARAGAGYNNIPVDRATEAGIVVFNTPGANANAVTELVIGGLVLSSRPVIEAAEWVKSLSGKGAEVPAMVEKGKNQFVGPELRGKTLGVIGLGAVGGPTANIAVAMGMNVIGFDPHMSVAAAWALTRQVHRAAEEDALLAESDYITLHLPLMADTRGKVNAAFIAKMKDGATLLNFARGELCVDADILAALESGKLRKYITDFPSDALIGAPGVIAIPHLGASTPESEENCADMAAQQIAAYLRDGTIHNSVNFPPCHMTRTAAARLCCMHQNAPGVISAITALISEAGLNIANMINVGGKMGYTMLDLDSAPDAKLLGRIEALESIIRTRVL